jgi:type IV secretion system protein VirD4
MKLRCVVLAQRSFCGGGNLLKQTSRAGGLLGCLLFYIPVVWAALLLAQSLGGGLADILSNLTVALEHPLDIHWTKYSAISILICTGAYIMALCVYSANQGRTREGEEHGSASWASPRQVNAMFAQKENKLLTRNVRLGLDTHKHRRSLNVLVIGGSGAAKTRGYVKPNILEANTNYVITDPKMEVLTATGGYLKSQGYEIRVLNLVNLEQSDGYNPFRYLHDEKDALKLVNNLIQATTPKGSHESDPFWVKSETALLQAIILMLFQEAPEYEQNFSMVMRVLEYAEVKEEDEEYVSPLDLLFQSMEREDPTSVAVRQYKVFKLAAGKTSKSILVSTAVRLAPFNLPQIKAITDHDNMDLYSLGEKKCALYAVIPDNDQSFNFLVSLLYAQAFQALYYSADQIHRGALPRHVHFILDEFAAMPLPGFTRELATMRSRNISASTIIQNMAQIKELYKNSWETIPGNSDTILFLGGNESSTHKYISEALGKSTIHTKTHGQTKGRSGSWSTNFQMSGRELLTPDEVRQLDNRYAILLIRGAKPVMDLKYDLTKHPAVRYTVDGGGPPYIHHQEKPKSWLSGNPVFVPEADDRKELLVHERNEI